MISPLPFTVRALIPTIIKDKGRIRAETMLSMQTADPGVIRRHLLQLHIELGQESPGLLALEDLVSASERAVDMSQPTRKEQHVISRVVLKQFVEPRERGGDALAKYDLLTHRPPRLV